MKDSQQDLEREAVEREILEDLLAIKTSEIEVAIKDQKFKSEDSCAAAVLALIKAGAIRHVKIEY